MTVPRWFYIVIAISVGLFAGASALRNVFGIAGSRFSYHPETSSHHAVVFDGRTGTACEFYPGANKNPNAFICLDYPSQRIDVWREKVVRHFAEESAAEPAPMDTGMKMMDSTAMMDSIARADSLRRQ